MPKDRDQWLEDQAEERRRLQDDEPPDEWYDDRFADVMLQTGLSRISQYCPCGECPLDREKWSDSCKLDDLGGL